MLTALFLKTFFFIKKYLSFNKTTHAYASFDETSKLFSVHLNLFVLHQLYGTYKINRRIKILIQDLYFIKIVET